MRKTVKKVEKYKIVLPVQNNLSKKSIAGIMYTTTILIKK